MWFENVIQLCAPAGDRYQRYQLIPYDHTDRLLGNVYEPFYCPARCAPLASDDIERLRYRHNSAD